jgi:hypothetical protein
LFFVIFFIFIYPLVLHHLFLVLSMVKHFDPACVLAE